MGVNSALLNVLRGGRINSSFTAAEKLYQRVLWAIEDSLSAGAKNALEVHKMLPYLKRVSPLTIDIIGEKHPDFEFDGRIIDPKLTFDMNYLMVIDEIEGETFNHYGNWQEVVDELGYSRNITLALAWAAQIHHPEEGAISKQELFASLGSQRRAKLLLGDLNLQILLSEDIDPYFGIEQMVDYNLNLGEMELLLGLKSQNIHHELRRRKLINKWQEIRRAEKQPPRSVFKHNLLTSFGKDLWAYTRHKAEEGSVVAKAMGAYSTRGRNSGINLSLGMILITRVKEAQNQIKPNGRPPGLRDLVEGLSVTVHSAEDYYVKVNEDLPSGRRLLRQVPKSVDWFIRDALAFNSNLSIKDRAWYMDLPFHVVKRRAVKHGFGTMGGYATHGRINYRSADLFYLAMDDSTLTKADAIELGGVRGERAFLELLDRKTELRREIGSFKGHVTKLKKKYGLTIS